MYMEHRNAADFIPLIISQSPSQANRTEYNFKSRIKAINKTNNSEAVHRINEWQAQLH